MTQFGYHLTLESPPGVSKILPINPRTVPIQADGIAIAITVGAYDFGPDWEISVPGCHCAGNAHDGPQA
jgi:hypothetical protein